MNKYMLTKLNTNWADEMDLAGFAVVTLEEWAGFVKMVKSFFKGDDRTFTFYVGTNEEIEFESAEGILEEITTTPITTEEKELLYSLFEFNEYNNSLGFSHLAIEDQLAEIMENESEEE
jgi:hypothetical protein